MKKDQASELQHLASSWIIEATSSLAFCHILLGDRPQYKETRKLIRDAFRTITQAAETIEKNLEVVK